MEAGNDFKSYRDLEVWKLAMLLCQDVYRVTKLFPNDERFGLTSQMRRAAVSIPSNIAEGHARAGTAEFLNFLSIALGSTAELETQVFLSIDLGFLPHNEADTVLQKLERIGKMLRGLRRSLQQRRKL